MEDSAALHPEEEVKKQLVTRAKTKGEIQAQTNKLKRRIIIGVVLGFSLIDVLGTCLFMPAGPILCQQAEGGPIESYAELLAVPPGAVDFDEYGLSDLFKDTFADMDNIAISDFNKSRYDLTMGELRKIAIDYLGNPRAFADVPARFSTSVNILVVAGSLSTGIGGAAWGYAADKYPHKICMLICCCGGLLGYVTMYLSGMVWNSYWLYLVGQLLNGFFSGAMVINNSYFIRLLGKEDAEGPNGAIMGMSLVGGCIGSLILMPFISGRGGDVFLAGWIGIAGTVFSAVAIVVFVPNVQQRTEEEKAKEKASGTSKTNNQEGKEAWADPASKPEKSLSTISSKNLKRVSQICWIAVIASSLDAAGDEGTRIARGTVLQTVWPATNDIQFQNILLLSLIFFLFLVLGMVEALKRAIGLPLTCVVGSGMTLVTQLLLNGAIIKWEGYQGFLACWYGGKLFGMCSTFAAFYIINEVAPEEEIGLWQGKQSGLGAICETISTLSMAVVYDELNDGSEEGRRGNVAMFITAGVSLFAMLAYTPLVFMYEGKAKKKEELEKKFDLTNEEFESLSDEQYRQLTMEALEFYEVRRCTADPTKLPREFGWGKYTDDLQYLEGMMDRSHDNLKYMRKDIIQVLTDGPRMEQQRDMWIKQRQARMEMEGAKLEDKKQQMGKWIADYFDDAGYDGWEQFPEMFKVLIMNAFPAIDALDGKQPDPETADVENLMISFLSVLDQHIRSREKQMGVISGLPKWFRLRAAK